MRFVQNVCNHVSNHTVSYLQYYNLAYVVGSKIFRPDIQKPRQTENAVRDI
jgi:hypothetical protein